MHYIRKEASGQLVFAQSTDFLVLSAAWLICEAFHSASVAFLKS